VSSSDDEVVTLRAEVKRKNDLIGQLSDTVARLNREMDETERRLRDELRGVKDRAGSQDEELAELRKWSDELESREGKLRSELQAATTERDELRRTAARATESLETEKKMQDERYAALQDELKDTNLIATEHESARKDTERKLADAERRLASTEEARARLEADRDALQDAAGSDAKRASELQERVTELEAEFGSQRKRSDEELKRLRRSENRWRGDAETSRSRLGEVVGQLKAAVSLLDELPAAPSEDGEVEASGPAPEAAPEPEGAGGQD
jgi:chromosome segregation ATPase